MTVFALKWPQCITSQGFTEFNITVRFNNTISTTMCPVQDDWSSLKEVTLKDMASDEEYDSETVYGEWRLTPDSFCCLSACFSCLIMSDVYSFFSLTGSSFFVPVAGFICRLCNKFYHFESSALHTHCKSMKHFENLKVGF